MINLRSEIDMFRLLCIRMWKKSENYEFLIGIFVDQKYSLVKSVRRTLILSPKKKYSSHTNFVTKKYSSVKNFVTKRFFRLFYPTKFPPIRYVELFCNVSWRVCSWLVFLWTSHLINHLFIFNRSRCSWWARTTLPLHRSILNVSVHQSLNRRFVPFFFWIFFPYFVEWISLSYKNLMMDLSSSEKPSFQCSSIYCQSDERYQT